MHLPGAGKAAVRRLIDILRLQGIRTVYGCVTVPNEKSEGLHQALGFRRLGTYRSTGYKCGAWRDVAWFEKPIAPYDQNPEPIRPVGDIPAEALAAILKRYEAEQPERDAGKERSLSAPLFLTMGTQLAHGDDPAWCQAACPTGCR